MKAFICVCEGGVSVAQNEKRAAARGLYAAGHYNQAGGYCCPHHGNTCGSHPEYESIREFHKHLKNCGY